jgi:hypothetical protein
MNHMEDALPENDPRPLTPGQAKAKDHFAGDRAKDEPVETSEESK